MRQSGVLAAAALHALDHHLTRLADDHANARSLASGASRMQGISLAIPAERTPTNMAFLSVDPRLGTAADICDRMARHGVLAMPMDPQRIRMVTHLDVQAADVEVALRALESALQVG